MADLALGRTPVREALLRLAGHNMVDTEAGRGFVVRPITLQRTRAVFEALEILELGVARLAVHQPCRVALERMEAANRIFREQVEEAKAGRCDVIGLVEANHEFHRHFAQCAGNEYLLRALDEVRFEGDRLAFLSYGTDIGAGASLADHYASVIEEHDRFMVLIERKDGERLSKVVVEHLNAFKQRIVQYLTHSGG
jgi:DNA-binding GntR family transcriptional regulator